MSFFDGGMIFRWEGDCDGTSSRVLQVSALTDARPCRGIFKLHGHLRYHPRT